MPRQSMNLLCSYWYDPLDRLVASTPSTQASTQRFYLKDRLATVIQGTTQRSIMQHNDQLLAQQQRQGGAAVETALLATDQQRSVLTLLDAKRPHAFAYTPYGHCVAGGLLSLLGFNGERPDPVTGWYLLGNGYRPFNPVLMCFTSPDSWSPFGEGGLNAYGYCLGDPVNLEDRTGHAPFFLKFFSFRKLRIKNPLSLTESTDSLTPLIRKQATKRKPTIDEILYDAKQSKLTANAMSYTGEKLEKLNSAIKELSNYNQNRNTVIERYTESIRTAEAPHRNFKIVQNDRSYKYESQATQRYEKKLTKLMNNTTTKTQDLNKRLRTTA